MGLWSAADDLLRGGRRAIGGFADSITGKEVKNAQSYLDNARRAQGDLGKLSPQDVYKQRMGVAPVKDHELEAAKGFYGDAVSSAADNVEYALDDLDMARFDRNLARSSLGVIGAAGAGAGGAIALGSGAFDGVNFGSGSPTFTSTPTSTATPQITDREFDYVAPTSKTPAYVPDTSKYDLKPTYIPSETLPDIPEAPPPDMLGATSTPGEYVIQKGDTLWDLTGGDQEKIKELAALNNIKNVDLILAGATLKTPSMDYLNRQLVG